ncbi:MAG: tetratricopeptide repeat protein [Nitrospinaceae bacterium]|jgi:Flp pilus assembly protein TadD|nr:tetratricopeptide repeat protein [Nitrospinaceae bacterium]MBT3432920.1 tetratricopeptide repeat protein [Nitrospinaceae bacterium]MBT3822553.1 tetratricopeptide repeat protein [Nitrospinaceae bacterium]MBT4093418.1 tetratricopeptide repeat protein [Nitrospinaceae bacterium]MBT5366539.1 tetratricopeptide repeat protein [Nitrospinaceae bacterium]
MGNKNKRITNDVANLAEEHIKRGNALESAGRLNDAASQFRRAISLAPENETARLGLSGVLLRQGKLSEGIKSIEAVLSINPSDVEAHNRLGIALERQGNLLEAEAAFEQAISLEPGFAPAYSNLGNILQAQGDLARAEENIRKAIDFRPESEITHNNLGNTLHKLGRLDEAATCYKKSLSLNPAYKTAAYNLSITLLLKGDLTTGWQHYESRWESPHFQDEMKTFEQPLWEGSPLEGKTILLHSEQGIGDTLQFVRYAKLIAEQGGKIILECQASLKKLIEKMPEFYAVIAEGESRPAFDLQAPLLSLPKIMGTTLETIPMEVPYIRALENQETANAISSSPGHLKVGLVWAGNPEHENDRNRSIPLENFGALLNTSNTRIFSLQLERENIRIRELGFDNKLRDLGPLVRGFDATAAAIEKLDLVVSVDTAAAHLAGAMGKSVWCLLSFVPDWRWMLTREDTPWYPTMRLFRQKRIGNWEEVIREVGDSLRRLASTS